MTEVTDISAPAVEPAKPAASDQELTDALAGVRRRSQLIVTERWLMVAGAVMMPLGVAFTLLGWYGAAHTTRLFEQVPYLVSGGILGLGLIVIGGACYFGYWVARQVGNQREMLDTLVRIEERLGAGAAAATANGDAGGSRGGPPLYATKTGTMYHRADCPVVLNRPSSELRVVRAGEKGLTPCRICDAPATV
jgi:hypothetical protein